MVWYKDTVNINNYRKHYEAVHELLTGSDIDDFTSLEWKFPEHISQYCRKHNFSASAEHLVKLYAEIWPLNNTENYYYQL